MTAVSPYFTFPRISWWSEVMNADTVIFDAGEHFQKMSARNRYHISGANNSIKLTVPLVNGRNQRVPMKDVLIFNEERWQVQHWRTLVSVYKRTPFFDHYEDSLSVLFETPFSHLIDYNKATMRWVKQQLRMQFEEKETDVFMKDHLDADVDLRKHKPVSRQLPKYYQVFEDRLGFIPDLSILDLLFSEGLGTVALL